ncbi:ParA family protein [Bradyrhizobium liaoningense]|uniref:ParA family protein n=1 Tax=Bradyrhizobium liaoningense TaxID=43992 RepID=UPI001BACBFB9|nr:ParA family protein [Bradyrhizobium liaoningense]MBR0716897.1 ParA family protein [Bradyrhizobium liaoningense]
MHTIVLATQKGGSGKSTLAIGLAVAAKKAGHNVRLIDADPQETLASWHKRRVDAEPIVETIHAAQDIEPRLRALRDSGVTLTIIDAAGGVSSARTAAIRHADLCLIPARPTTADIEATASTLSLVRAWNKPFAFVLNQVPSRGRRIDDAAETLADEAAIDLGEVLARPFIVMRNDHQDALSAGLAVSEYEPAGKSTEEIRRLWNWIEARLGADAADVVATSPFAGLNLPIRAEPAAFTL